MNFFFLNVEYFRTAVGSRWSRSRCGCRSQGSGVTTPVTNSGGRSGDCGCDCGCDRRRHERQRPFSLTQRDPERRDYVGEKRLQLLLRRLLVLLLEHVLRRRPGQDLMILIRIRIEILRRER